MSSKRKDISRNKFLWKLISLSSVFLAFITFTFKKQLQRFPVFSFLIKGKIVGLDPNFGHLLRNPILQKSIKDTVAMENHNYKEVVIVGGGVSGLSAARHLLSQNFTNFSILEMENSVGGNSIGGRRNQQKYPWGAHYLPLPNAETVHVRELLAEMGILKNNVYDEKYICSAPRERLFIYGRWQDGLFPHLGASSNDLNELKRFSRLIEFYRNYQAKDNKKAFAIPLDYSSRDAELIKLDRISFYEFIKSKGFRSNRLLWFIEYATRDDYGASLKDTSAWAGLHYFASRPKDNRLLAWPEGNSFLVNYLKNYNKGHIESNSFLQNVKKLSSGKYILTLIERKTMKTKQITCAKIIFAAPKFQLPYIFNSKVDASSDEHYKTDFASFEYSPWLVANIHLNNQLWANQLSAWDNVLYDSEGLGYIDNQHSAGEYRLSESSLTYYHPFIYDSPKSTRRRLLKMKHNDAVELVAKDLTQAIPDFRARLNSIDFYFWAHAMIRPTPNFIWSGQRQKLFTQFAKDNIYLAHSDMSGISIFEEAQYQGIKAAKRLLKYSG